MTAMGNALFATQIALSREQKLTDLGGVIAAAAHELGTPLATIKLTAGELVEDLSQYPELKDDAELIRQEANRCRDILHSMGRVGKDDLHLRNAPLSEVLREAAEPHIERGKIINSAIIGDLDPADQPLIYRHPEIIHGLRNMIQNAVDFARTAIWVDYSWDSESIIIRISDDGNGYPEHMLNRIGDPFVRSTKHRQDRNQRPGYKGMGLGLFIAKTLLERTGASLKFANGANAETGPTKSSERSGAIVQIIWDRAKIEHITQELGPNIMINHY
jgi:two-component system sensor histidine kinase RegB